MNERIPAETFPPGEYLRDELDARGWTQTEFAEILGRPTRVVNEIISAKKSVTPDTAKELAAALGTSAQFWMNLETAYQLAKSDPAPQHISRVAKLRERFPVREMVKRGWIIPSDSQEVTETRVLSFFGLQSVNDTIDFLHAARRNYAAELSVVQYAWLFRVKQLSETMPATQYSENNLRSALTRLSAMTNEPEEARHVPRLLSECGVRFVVVEAFPGSKIDGVCFWVNNQRTPVIGMTLRFDRNDNFWFVLRHEIEHVLCKHAQSEAIIDEDLACGSNDIDADEAVANSAAQEFCVPTREIDDFIARVKPFFSEEKVLKFSKRIGRHPGIVVGQLQRRLDRPDFLNKLKAKIRLHVVASALADGWGTAAPV